MKATIKSAFFGLILLAASSVHAQLRLTSEQLAAIESTPVTPASELPAVGTFYSAANPQLPPLPGNPQQLSAWVLSGLSENTFLLDDLGGSSGGSFHTMDDSEPPLPGSGGDGGSGGDFTNNPSPHFPTNGLWMQITNVADDAVYVNLYGATDYVYSIWSSTNLSSGGNVWNVETEVFPGTNTNSAPFTVSMNGRNTLFLSAMDWTGVTANGNQTPQWWFYYWFGSAGLSLSDNDLDSAGNTLYSDYISGTDPNIIAFTLSCTNQYINASGGSVQLDVTAGIPDYAAVLVDDTNPADANWTAYTSPNITVNLGSTQGWHNVYVGLRGLTTADQTWLSTRLKLDLTAPLLALTNPMCGNVIESVIQLQGYSNEKLADISYDLSNSNGSATNQQVLILDQYYDTNALEYTTNYFQCFDVPLAVGQNVVTLHATDLAGNVTLTNFTFDYSVPTNPPVIQLNWPQNGTQISGTNFTWRGYVNEATAQVTAQVVNTNGITNSVTAQVGRGGDFWAYGLPLSGGTNYLSLTATDAAGNTSTTNIAVTQSCLILTITSAVFGQPVQGTISDWTNYTVWVNGIMATNNGDGTWTTSTILPLGTSVVQARAIPNSDNGGYGGGQ